MATGYFSPYVRASRDKRKIDQRSAYLTKSGFPSSLPLCSSPLVQAKMLAMGLVLVGFPCRERDQILYYTSTVVFGRPLCCIALKTLRLFYLLSIVVLIDSCNYSTSIRLLRPHVRHRDELRINLHWWSLPSGVHGSAW